MVAKIKILMLEDNTSDAELIRQTIKKNNIVFDYKLVETENDFINSLKTYNPDIILSDYTLPNFNGIQALKYRNEMCPLTPFILVTGSTNEEIAVSCMKAGTDDYILKDNLTRLGQAIKSVIEKKHVLVAKLKAENELRRSEANTRALIENTEGSIWSVDRNFCLIEANSRYLSRMKEGVGKDIKIGDNVIKILPESIQSEWIDYYKRGFSGEIFQIQTDTIHPFKSLSLIYNFNPIRTLDGNIIGVTIFGHDISDIIKAEEKLKDSESKFRHIFENSPIGKSITQIDGTITVNKAFIEMLGYSPEEFNIKNWNEITHSDDIQRTNEAIRDLLAGRFESIRFEKRYIHKDGSIIWIDLQTSLQTDTDGKPKFFITSLNNITERKQNEKALKKSELEYRNLFESANDAIIIFEPESEIILDVNKKACDIYGFTKEDILGKSMKDWSVTVDKGEQHILQTLRDGSKKDYETQHYTKDRNIIHILSSASVIEYGGKTAIMSINRDITERKKAEELLRQSEERFQLASRATNDIIYDWNMENNTGWFSDSFVRQFGYEETSIIFEEWKKLIHPEDIERAMAFTESIILDGKSSWTIEYRLKRNDGTYAYVVDSGYVVRNEYGKPSRLIGSIMDFTERKKAEEALRVSETRFRKIFEESPFGIALVNINFGFEKVNPEFCNMMKYSEKELYEMTFKEITHQNYLGKDIENLELLIADKIPLYLTEKIYITKDGENCWGEVHVSVIKDNNGSFQYFLVMIEDINERKIVEEAVKESEEHFKSIVKSADAAYFRINKDGLYEEVNDSWLRIHKYKSQNEIIGKHFSCTQVDNEIENAGELVNELLKGKPIETGEFSRLCKDGSVGYHTYSINPVIKNGRILGIEGFLIDTTEQKNALEELNESREKYRILFETMKEGVVYVDNDDVIQFINKSGCSIYGYDSEELIGKIGYKFLIHPEDRKIVIDKNKSRIDGISDSYEIRGLKNSGEPIWLRVSGSPVRDKEGKVVGSVGILSDITERKHTEDALRKSEEQYRELVTQMTDGVYQSTHDGKFLSINNAMVKMFGYDSIDEMLRIDINRDLYFNIEDRYTDYPADDKEHLLVMRLKKKDGTPIWVEESGWYIKDSEGNIIRHEGILRDITERKNAEDTIRKLSVTVEQSPVSIVITDLKGNIEYVNPKFEEITGYSFAESRGQNPRILKTDEIPSEGYKNLWDTITSGKEWRGEFHNRKKNGETFWESASVSPIRDADGIITHYLAVKEDITEKKEREKELILAKVKAEESERLKSNFLANMSHELRTPMVGILGFSEILMSDITDESQSDMMSKIHLSGQRLMSTLNLILDLSRIEAGKLEMVSKEFDITETIKESIGLFESTAKKKKLYIKFCNNTDNLKIVQDERIIRDVLNNLLNNAVKYTNEGGIDIYASVVTEKGIRYFVLSVKDTGIGIPENKLDVIFEEFRQVSEGKSRKFEGTGLGLSITKKFVEKMNGIISVESTLGKGSLFIVKIPVNSDSAVVKSDKTKKFIRKLKTSGPDERNNEDKLSVLIVDDDDSTSMLCSLYLRNNFNVDSASCAEGAFKLVSGKKYDLILMDINLGKGKNGLEITSDIRKIRGYENIPVIALTAYAMKGDREEFIKAGCIDYISKPFRKDDFLDVIKRVILKC